MKISNRKTKFHKKTHLKMRLNRHTTVNTFEDCLSCVCAVSWATFWLSPACCLSLGSGSVGSRHGGDQTQAPGFQGSLQIGPQRVPWDHMFSRLHDVCWRSSVRWGWWTELEALPGGPVFLPGWCAFVDCFTSAAGKFLVQNH